MLQLTNCHAAPHSGPEAEKKHFQRRYLSFLAFTVIRKYKSTTLRSKRGSKIGGQLTYGRSSFGKGINKLEKRLEKVEKPENRGYTPANGM